MSFLNQSGDLMPFAEVVPAAASFGAPERSSILTSRRRVRTTPQTGPSIGSAGAGAGGQQVQFLISDAAGMIDMRSVVINYTQLVSGASAPCPDDGTPFTVVQALLGGQLLENIQNAPKVMNAEMCLAGSKTYYQTAGSFQGFELLSDDLDTIFTAPTSATYVAGSQNAYGFVAGNLTAINARATRAAAAQYNNIAGVQRSVPLGLMCGLGRCSQYVPLAVLGDLSLVFQTGQPNEVLVANTATTGADYSLSQISLEYDVVIPDQRLFSVLQKVATEDPVGLVIPYESSIVATGGVIAGSPSGLTENTIIASRATNNLLRAAVIQIPAQGVSSLTYPSQSCMSKAGVFSAQYRVGSTVYPQTAPSGDASLFNMSLAAYGSVMQENGSITNRVLWANSTSATTAGTIGVHETAVAYYGATQNATDVKFAFGDRCVIAYGFQTVKGAAEPNMVDGVSLAGSSGSQIICTLVSAPAVNYTPYIILTALRFIVAKGGASSVMGA